jgi:hypothetical protein
VSHRRTSIGKDVSRSVIRVIGKNKELAASADPDDPA